MLICTWPFCIRLPIRVLSPVQLEPSSEAVRYLTIILRMCVKYISKRFAPRSLNTCVNFLRDLLRNNLSTWLSHPRGYPSERLSRYNHLSVGDSICPPIPQPNDVRYTFIAHRIAVWILSATFLYFRDGQYPGFDVFLHRCWLHYRQCHINVHDMLINMCIMMLCRH